MHVSFELQVARKSVVSPVIFVTYLFFYIFYAVIVVYFVVERNLFILQRTILLTFTH